MPAGLGLAAAGLPENDGNGAASARSASAKMPGKRMANPPPGRASSGKAAAVRESSFAGR